MGVKNMKKFILEFDVVGVESRVFMHIDAETWEEAHDYACETLVQIKHGDIELVNIAHKGK